MRAFQPNTIDSFKHEFEPKSQLPDRKHTGAIISIYCDYHVKQVDAMRGGNPEVLYGQAIRSKPEPQEYSTEIEIRFSWPCYRQMDMT
jgi:hypothetical protein